MTVSFSADMTDCRAREAWVDAFRGLAVVGMIWVHAANTFLREEVRQQEWFATAGFFHGLIAPAFFWIAGYVRGVRAGGGRPGWASVRRLLVVMALGYSLRFPVWPLLSGGFTAAHWQEMVKVDVLQTLAFTGLLMVAVERWIGGVGWQRLVMAMLAAGFVLGQTAAADWRTGWLVVDAWLNREGGSLFPLFPWVGFGLAGWLCGSGVSWGQRRFSRAGCGVAMVCVVVAAGWVMPRIDGVAEPTAFFWQRLGWVMALAMGMFALMEPGGGRGRMSRVLTLAGRQSLVMYLAHLWLIHAVPLLTMSLEQRWKGQFGLAGASGVFAGLLAASLGLAALNARRRVLASRRERRTVDPKGG